MVNIDNSLTLWQMDCLEKIEKLTDSDTIPLLTIGYEGYNAENFVETLKAFDVDYLFDVREIPFSWKKGFSKTPLKAMMEDNSIGYTNFKELGSPKEIRDRLHKDGDYKLFFSDYSEYLKTQKDTLTIVTTAINENPDKQFCLLCFEKNPEICHRSVLASEISKLSSENVQVFNI